MTVDERILTPEEKAAFTLRALYAANGYRQYKMSKFEEYDLYVRNKDFLISDNVITFTDTNGKLMALKPDVTLSIIRSTANAPGETHRIYYSENVYRVSKGTHRFQEIPQTGLECIGPLSAADLAQVTGLAAKSLLALSPSAVLNVSHLGILRSLLDPAGADPETAQRITRAIGEKNPHELAALCAAAGISEETAGLLGRLLGVYGDVESAMRQLIPLLGTTPAAPALEALCAILSQLDGESEKIVRFDFSVVNDPRYYNGVVFKGYIEGLPGSVLSGGQYDRLMRRMRRPDGAVGFAVYMDQLERLRDGGNADA